MRAFVIASREVAKQSSLLLKALDCFAEPVIGPATSGRTRWLAMTKPRALTPRLDDDFRMLLGVAEIVERLGNAVDSDVARLSPDGLKAGLTCQQRDPMNRRACG